MAIYTSGGTVPWLGLTQPALHSIDHPHWGGWSGRFSVSKKAQVWSKHKEIKADEQNYGSFAMFTEVPDQWISAEEGFDYSGIFAPVWRWRQAMYNDYKARMDWTRYSFKEANHNPVIKIKNIESGQIGLVKVSPGQTVQFDASASSDPDGDDLQFNWWIYQEPSRAAKLPSIKSANNSKVSLNVPEDFTEGEIHLILEVKDDYESVSLYAYQRIVLTPLTD